MPSTPASSASARWRSATTPTGWPGSPGPSIEAGPHSIWRYAGLLPAGQDPATRVDSGTGMTPLIRADRLADRLGFTAPLWVKDDSANPTHSFKDRVVSVAITAARELGFTPDRLRLDRQPGQLGRRARRPDRHGLDRVRARRTWSRPRSPRPRSTAAPWSAIEGSYDDVNRLCSELSETDEFESTAFVNVNVRPYYAEGSKTLGFEVAEQLGWRLPAAGGGADGLRARC